MKTFTLSLALAMFAALSAPAFASSFDTATSFKKVQGEQVAKKSKKASKSKKNA
jgi:hypothetical protein